MAYIALYRKYRPQNFDDIVGQENITKILKKQITSGKISHAYIFSGTRGTGKTSAAKIFARAINCLNPKDGEPCNECEACRSILDGNTTDVVEMDAASNNSVENIRSIRQEVAYSTTSLKYKVYIIDEAHMLSTSAFNALLKTLEEPPANVVFILATTEEHKILPTILSRCIRFEFKKLKVENIVKRLEYVLKDYNLDYELEALKHIAELADGGMRDALSILERLITSSDGKITEAKIEEIIGTVPAEIIKRLVKHILNYDVVNLNQVIDELLNTGKDLRNITSKVTEEFLKLLIAKTSEEYTDIDKQLVDTLKSMSVTRLHQVIKALSKLDDDLRQSNNVSVVFKAKLMELAISTVSLNENELLAKIEELELKLDKLQSGVVECKTAKSAPKKESKVEVKTENVEQATISEPTVDAVNQNQQAQEMKIAEVKTSKKELKELKNIMQRAVESDNLKLYSALAGAKAYQDDQAVVFSTTNAFAYGVLNKEGSKEDLRKIVQEELQQEINIKIEYIKEEKKQDNAFEQLVKDSGVPFEVLD